MTYGTGYRKLDRSIKVRPSVVADVPPIPFVDDSFDVILAFHIFEHVSPERFPHLIRECWRILTPGGLLHVRQPVSLTHLLVKAAEDPQKLNQAHMHAINPYHLNKWIEPETFRFFDDWHTEDRDFNFIVIGWAEGKIEFILKAIAEKNGCPPKDTIDKLKQNWLNKPFDAMERIPDLDSIRREKT